MDGIPGRRPFSCSSWAGRVRSGDDVDVAWTVLLVIALASASLGRGWLPATALLGVVCGAVALAGHARQAGHRRHGRPRYTRRTGSDRMDRIHRRLRAGPSARPGTARIGDPGRCLGGGQQLLLAGLDLDHHQPPPGELGTGPGNHVTDDPRHQRP